MPVVASASAAAVAALKTAGFVVVFAYYQLESVGCAYVKYLQNKRSPTSRIFRPQSANMFYYDSRLIE